MLSGAARADRLNVVLILIDDLNHYGVTAYGADRISEWSELFKNRAFRTPRVDRLAREGLRCDNVYVYPLCEPTRIALMSGQYNSRNFLRCKSQHASEIRKTYGPFREGVQAGGGEITVAGEGEIAGRGERGERRKKPGARPKPTTRGEDHLRR